MDSRKTPTSITIIYYLTQFIYWSILVAGVLAVLLFVGNVMGLTLGGSETSVQLPVKLNVTETGVINLGGEKYPVNITEASGTFLFSKLPGRVVGFLIPVLIGLLGLVWLLIRFFRKFITNVKRGEYFSKENINYLKKMAYCLLGLWVYVLLVSNLFLGFIISTMEFETVTFSGIKSETSHLLFAALFLWVLSHIFSKGVTLKTDQELTI